MRTEYTNQQLRKLSEPGMYYFAIGSDDKDILRKMQGVGYFIGKRYNTQDRDEIHDYVRLYCHYKGCDASNIVDMLCFVQDNWSDFVAWIKKDFPLPTDTKNQ